MLNIKNASNTKIEKKEDGRNLTTDPNTVENNRFHILPATV